MKLTAILVESVSAVLVSAASFVSCSTSGRTSRSSPCFASKAALYCSAILLISASVSYSPHAQSVLVSDTARRVGTYLLHRLKSGDVARLFFVEFVSPLSDLSFEFSFPCVEFANVVLSPSLRCQHTILKRGVSRGERTHFESFPRAFSRCSQTSSFLLLTIETDNVICDPCNLTFERTIM